jgi:hypothetical protein
MKYLSIYIKPGTENISYSDVQDGKENYYI